MTEKEIAGKIYRMYVELRKSGFEDGITLGILSQTVTHLLMQSVIQEKQIVKIIMEEK